MVRNSYTTQQKEQARQTDMIDFLEKYEGFTFKKSGNGYKCVEHNSLVIMQDRTGWYWNSQDKGGSNAIDYCQKIKGMTFPEALQALVGQGNEISQAPVKKVNTNALEPAERQVFVLPEKAEGQFKNAFAYLSSSRKIDSCIISKLMTDKQIYQDKNNNVVFVGFDEESQAKFACVRGTLSDKSFRGDCKGSDKQYSFSIDGTNKTKLYIFESPIDLLSHATLANKVVKNERAWTVHNRLSLAGTTDVALEHYLTAHPDVKELVFCLDNDEAGIKATSEHKEKYQAKGYIVSDIPPKNKDYNEDLIAFVKTKEQKQAPKQPPPQGRGR